MDLFLLEFGIDDVLARAKLTLYWYLKVNMLNAVTANFLGDSLQCWMQIQVGKGPWASEVSGIVKIGQTMTMVLGIKGGRRQSRFNGFCGIYTIWLQLRVQGVDSVNKNTPPDLPPSLPPLVNFLKRAHVWTAILDTFLYCVISDSRANPGAYFC